MKWIPLIVFTMWASLSFAGDWPQILGPQRSGAAASDERLASRWPSEGPPKLWSRPVGTGYAGLAVSGETGILFHRIHDEEVVEGLDVATGKTRYRLSWPTTFTPQVGKEDGPLCVPTIRGQRVVTFGAQGVLTCFELGTGRQLWQRNTHREFGAQEGYFGAGSAPLIIGETVVVNVGGRKGNGIVGFALSSGEVLWKETDDPASYSAPIEVNVDGHQLVLMVTRYNCRLVDPASGAILFTFPFGQRGPTVNGACPVVMGDRLLVTSSYGLGAKYAEFGILGTNLLWEGERPIATQYCTPIHIDGHLYLINGREDVPPADLECVDLNVLGGSSRRDRSSPSSSLANPLSWIEQNFGYGTLIYADGKLLAQKTSGTLVMIQPNPDRLQILSRFQPLTGTTRALPALSNGRYFLRNEKTLACWNVGREF